jgi:hypothetical protein
MRTRYLCRHCKEHKVIKDSGNDIWLCPVCDSTYGGDEYPTDELSEDVKSVSMSLCLYCGAEDPELTSEKGSDTGVKSYCCSCRKSWIHPDALCKCCGFPARHCARKGAEIA